ncbi:MutL mismatch-repair protein pms1, partial [Cymbomonas tetramitiformis]
MATVSIKPIEKGCIHRICSGQVVLDLATAVKELVENSLDAGATTIEVKLKDYGSESIEVADNGSGVAPENYEALTVKYSTSKINTFNDLESLNSFGFRGEALSSLCALSKVSIVTRTKNEEMATRVEYDHGGKICTQATAARAVGTLVCVKDLFATLPVRHKEFKRNLKREYGRLISLLQAYALICTSVRMICTHQAKQGSRSTVVSTQGGGSLRGNLVTIFGAVTAAAMMQLEVDLSVLGCHVSGYLSKATAGCGRASGDRQFFFLNGRPVDLPKVGKLMNEIYRSFNMSQFPMVVIDFKIPTNNYDINVTPDKRKVFLQEEKTLLAELKEVLLGLYEPSRNTFHVQKVDVRPSHKAQEVTAAASNREPAVELVDENQRNPTGEPAAVKSLERDDLDLGRAAKR